MDRDEKFDGLDILITFYFDIDALGSSNYSNIIDNDEYALETLNATGRYVNNAWKVGLL